MINDQYTNLGLSKFQRYYRRHKKQRLLSAKNRRKNNIEDYRLRERDLYLKSNGKTRMISALAESKRLKEWYELLPNQFNCMVCGKELRLLSKKRGDSLCFDHRNEGKEPIKYKPHNWLRNHKRTSKSEKTWKDCNFGHLCRKCNLYFPTKNRKELVDNIVKYVYGEKYEIQKKTSSN